MKLINKINEDQMIAHFLKCELDNFIDGKKLRDYIISDNIPISIIENPNFNNIDENEIRRKILHYRGYPNKYLFEGFPKDLNWALYELDSQDFKKILYMNLEPFWLEISQGTRYVKNTKLNNINNPNQIKINEIISKINIGMSLPEIILVSDNDRMIVFEGHHRAAAYAIALQNKDIRIKAIIGVSKSLKDWNFY